MVQCDMWCLSGKVVQSALHCFLLPTDNWNINYAPEISMEVNPTGDKTLVKEVAVHQNNVVRDMIGAFCDNESLRCQLEVVLIDDKGETEERRGSEVTREALSIFWSEFFTWLVIGAAEKVPAIWYEFQKIEW